MKMINHDNGSVIIGEAGDNIGRGGRTSMYFKDESAHYERPEKIEAALGDNTNVQIDISSVNGLGNVFHRRREAGVIYERGKKLEPGYTQVFVVDWRDHPEKTQRWYDDRRAKYEREGMLHIFAQEVDRNYSAAVENVIIPAEWVEACIDAHKKFVWTDANGNTRIGYDDDDIPNIWNAGLDVADEGRDRNALTTRQWIIWRSAEEWGERDTGHTTRRAIAALQNLKKVTVQYDTIGVGAGVKSDYNRLVSEKIVDPYKIEFVPWSASAEVKDKFFHVIEDDPNSALNKDFYGNFKAQAYWSMRTRCYKTYKFITAGEMYPIDEMISIDSRMPLIHQVRKELSQSVLAHNGSLGIIVDKQPDGTASPNLADAGVMMFFPNDKGAKYASVGAYGH
jgi:hypothetical protein